MNNCKTETGKTLREMAGVMQTTLEELKEEMEEFVMALDRVLCLMLLEHTRKTLMKTLSKILIEDAVKNCQDEAVRQWLRENSESFSQLAAMFHFLKKHIDEEEKKNHSDHIDVIFVAHGSIRLPMIPARCLLPLPPITDVVLYSPWNCVSTADVVYGVATGKIQPQHRVFSCDTRKCCKIPDGNHRPTNLPNHWNSLKQAGGQKIPTITVSPLQPEDGVWNTYETLKIKHGPPGENRIVIPFILPGERSESVPLFVVTLALSLVLLSSRFTATVHLAACLGKTSADMKLDENCLKQQYAYAINDTCMNISPDMFSGTLLGFFKRLFG